MAEHFVAGCMGGAFGVLVGHPFDTIKVRMQASPTTYTGPIQCIKMIVFKEGTLGMYKGLLSPMYGFSLMNAIIFGIHGNIIKHFNNPDSLVAQSAAGCVAGLVQGFVCSPVELAKIRMQNQGQGQSYSVFKKGGGQQYRGPIDCLWKIYKIEGLSKGVFRGLGVTFLREGPSFAVYFPVFEGICRYFTPPGEKYSIYVMLFAGGMAGQACWLSTYPADVIKTRFQDDTKHKYRNLRHCTLETYRTGGVKVFFQGLSVTLLRAFPVNAACLTVSALVTRNVFRLKDE